MPFDLPLDYVLGFLAWVAGGSTSLALLLALRRHARLLSPQRFRLINAALSLWTFLAALTVVELYFAVVYDQSDSYNMSKVSEHWFARHVRRNEFGFRDDHEFPARVPEGRRRICFVGDSFTFGHGVKDVADRFSDRIARRLDVARPGEYVVSNIAETAWDVWDITDAVEAIVVNRDRHIDILVYAICLNDIEGYEPTSADEHKRLGLHAPQFLPFRDTYFLNLLYFRVRQAQLPEVRNYYSQLAASYRSPPWYGMQRKLDELREFCRDHGIDLRTVIFPFLHNLGPDYPFEVAHQQLAEYFRKADVPCLDLKPTLLPHTEEGLTVNRFDAHPNERAHALAAEAIERDLLADLFRRDQ